MRTLANTIQKMTKANVHHSVLTEFIRHSAEGCRQKQDNDASLSLENLKAILEMILRNLRRN